MKKFIYLILLIGSVTLAGEPSQYPTKEKIERTMVTIDSVKLQDSKNIIQQIKNIRNNETLYIEDGIYKNLGKINIKGDNTKITAKNLGKVFFIGPTQIHIIGDNNLLSGIVFTQGGPLDKKGAVVLSGRGNSFSNNIIYDFNDYDYIPNSKGEYPPMRWLTISGKENKVSNNRFEKKHKRGPILVVDNTDTTTPDRHIITNNIFKDTKRGIFHELDNEKLNNNSWETIRMGVGATSMTPSESRILYNLFQELDGEAEIISIKNSKVLVKGNTIKNSSGMISLRQGKNSIVEDNVILGERKNSSGGIRFYDADHIIRNNYIENVMGNRGMLGGITVNNGSYALKKDGEVNLVFQAPPKNNLVENNTIINSARNILYSYESHRDKKENEITVPAYGTVFRNNLSFAQEKGTRALLGASTMPQPTASRYIHENYFGEIKGVETLSSSSPSSSSGSGDSFESISRDKPQLSRKNGILVSIEENLGAKNLTIITEDMVGPTFRLK